MRRCVGLTCRTVALAAYSHWRLSGHLTSSSRFFFTLSFFPCSIRCHLLSHRQISRFSPPESLQYSLRFTSTDGTSFKGHESPPGSSAAAEPSIEKDSIGESNARGRDNGTTAGSMLGNAAQAKQDGASGGQETSGSCADKSSRPECTAEVSASHDKAASGADSSNENSEEAGTNAVTPVGEHLPRRRSFLEPSDDIVIETARRALGRDGRDEIPEAVVWTDDTSYPPILARGGKNVYYYTDDIPQHVRPYWGWQWYQQREYFRLARTVRTPWYYIKKSLPYILLFVFATTIAFTFQTWVQQPKDLIQLRAELLESAYGKVLEVAAGHGEKIGAYPYAAHTIVLSDSSLQQLQTLRYRIPKSVYPKYEVRVMRSEQLEGFKDGEFDCVVDMFGLCHLRDPVMALRQMQRVVKPTGIILLLEHGRSPYPPVNWLLDYLASRHKEKTHGCRWNLPMMDYIQKARLQVKEFRNLHYGTTYYVVAYPENIDEITKENEDQMDIGKVMLKPVGG